MSYQQKLCFWGYLCRGYVLVMYMVWEFIFAKFNKWLITHLLDSLINMIVGSTNLVADWNFRKKIFPTLQFKFTIKISNFCIISKMHSTHPQTPNFSTKTSVYFLQVSFSMCADVILIILCMSRKKYHFRGPRVQIIFMTFCVSHFCLIK